MNVITLNTDLSQRVLVDTQTLVWQPSPAVGVARKLLHRQGGERAVATSVVSYAAGSKFDRHVHDMGEEFFVLEGEFADEHGRYPAGSYVRNPWGSSHAPFSEQGCVLFVKLRQLDPADRRRQVVNSRALPWRPGPAAGIELIELGAFGAEQTSLVRWAAGASFPRHARRGGEGILLLDGEFQDEHGCYGPGCWLRLPPGHRHAPSSPQGCTFWVKAGHLVDSGALAAPALSQPMG